MESVRVGGDRTAPGRAEPTPAGYLSELLGRAENAFEVDSTTLLRLAGALMHQTELYSARRCNEPFRPMRCLTSRHIFLLADGGSLVLWELQHDTDEDGLLRSELYTDRESWERAELRVHRRLGDDPPREPISEVVGATDDLLAPTDLALPQRTYVEEGSAEHARRLLCRAENPDRPGEEVRRRLLKARAHDILRVPKPQGFGRQRHVWCSMYEHAFLLEGDDEMSLWELEHNLTPEADLVCEVYLEEGAAEEAADRHARALGVEL